MLEDRDELWRYKNCGEPYFLNESECQRLNDAIDKAVSSGWLHRPKERHDGSDAFEDYCPECRRKLGLY